MWRRAAALWRNLRHRGRVERDFEEELAAYEQMLLDERLSAWQETGEARRAVRLELGGSRDGIKEQVREVRMGFLLESIARDVRISARALCKQRGFTLTVVGVLALAIAGTTAIFSIYNSLYLRPLPFEDPERLVNLDEKAPQWNLERTAVAYPDFAAWKEQNRSFEAMAVFRQTGAVLGSEAGAELVPAGRSTHDLPTVLKVQPVLGRWFTADEDKPQGPKVVVVSHGLWQRRFGGPTSIAGQTLRIAAETFEVIGVMPAGFDFPNRAELWTPLQMTRTDSSGWGLVGVGRLKAGMTMDKAREDLTRVHKGMIPTRKVNEITSPTVYPLREWYVGRFLPASQILLAAVGLVLLIACANVAGIVLARGAARVREVSVQAALGAPRARIVRQLLTESLMLGIAGGALGLGLGWAGVRGLLALMPENQIPGWVRFDLDWRFLAFSLGISVGSAMLFGLWPAWSGSKADLRSGLHDGARSSGTPARRRSLQMLITAEVALAMVLLASAALLAQAFRKVERMDPGFQAGNMLVYSVGLPRQKYPKPEQQLAFVEELLRKQRAVPGVTAVEAASATPLGGHWGNFYEAEGAPAKRPGDPNPVILKRVVTPGYVIAMGMKPVAGRTFTEFDSVKPGMEAVLVNEMFAKANWPEQDAVGKRIRPTGGKDWWPVVGVIADVRDYGLDQPARPSVYFSLKQEPLGGVTVVTRVAPEIRDPEVLLNPARQVLAGMDPDVALARPTTMARMVGESMWMRRTYSFLVAAFAALALVLVGAGLFGVISYTVGQRRREIAIRLALGAGRERILRGVLREALVMAALGLTLGVGAAVAAARALPFDTLLFGVNPRDPATHAAAVGILVLVAVAASLLPAWRASRTAPAHALRLE